MFGVVAAAGAGFVVMHMQGEPRTMQARPALRRRRGRGRRLPASTGSPPRARPASTTASLCADPGIGFGKTAAHNLELLARLGELVARRRRAGARRTVAQDVHRRACSATTVGTAGRRDDGTLATVVWAVDQGARMVRVHDAGAAADALRLLAVMDAIDAEAVA